jgi:hypothetical protein
MVHPFDADRFSGWRGDSAYPWPCVFVMVSTHEVRRAETSLRIRLREDQSANRPARRAGLIHCRLKSAPARQGPLRDAAALRSSLASGVLDMPGFLASRHLPVTRTLNRSPLPNAHGPDLEPHRPQTDHKSSGNGGQCGGPAAFSAAGYQELL